ncbi:alpha/beta hydrolase [Streptomyces flavidovirens]|uniref:alpha/beta hydrolase n=1 Tax=Streptomyces flavidovirens TaxID=67298 RepID=UPI0006890964|nr:alpha/beta hydrolase [Streptomyces flavidovirens]
MGVIVGVHGVGQQQLGRQQLLQAWRPALGDGLERACGQPVPEVPLDLAFYGDAFLSAPGTSIPGKSTAMGAAWWERLDEEDYVELERAAREVLPERSIEEEQTASDKARTRVPGFLRAVDRHFPAGGILAFGDLIQVRRYLVNPVVKSRVDAAVDAAVTRQCQVLIGHSLGSVVAFEYLRRHPDARLELLVTLGSPLGLRLVRERMPHPAYGTGFGVPPAVRAWVNVYDTRDPVACAGPLARWWAGVRDCPPVDNGRDAHAVTAYLGKQATGHAVLGALPDLAAKPR